MVYDKKFAEMVRGSLKRKKGITEKMFNDIAFLLNGKMFCGIIKNDLVVRTGTQYYQKALAKYHAHGLYRQTDERIYLCRIRWLQNRENTFRVDRRRTSLY